MTEQNIEGTITHEEYTELKNALKQFEGNAKLSQMATTFVMRNKILAAMQYPRTWDVGNLVDEACQEGVIY